jgi:uncharacterized DUF497 family protein
VDIEYDSDKDKANRARHGVPLALGAIVIQNCIVELLDDREDYGEERMNAFGLVGDRCSSAPIRCAAKPGG